MPDPASQAASANDRITVPLTDVPAGLVAVLVDRTVSGEPRPPRDRRGRIRAAQVDLVARSAPTPATAPPLAAHDLRWLLGAQRRQWTAVERRFPGRARAVAEELARRGAVELRCDVLDGIRLGPPRSWRLTPPMVAQQAAHRADRRQVNDTWRRRADAAADLVVELDAGLAAALRTTPATPAAPARIPVLVHAAEDLIAGRRHDGPRAFSQTHFDHSKVRDDCAEILATAGASAESITTLGLDRSPYLGLGGPIALSGLDIAGRRGPVLLRADDPDLPAAWLTRAEHLVIVENLQAAEALCDQRPDVAVLYTAGPPGTAAVAAIARLAGQAVHALLIPDADLGGVRIAQRILDALTPHPRLDLVDIGTQPHHRREPFGTTSLTGLQVALTGSARFLAEACLRRGYPVEQEATTRAAVTAMLDS